MTKIKKKFTKYERRRITLFVTFFIILIVFMGTNIFPDWLKISSNKKELALLETEYEDMLSTEESLKAEVQKLKSPEYVERYAKEKFYYTKENEIIIRKTDSD